jgi:hypothetical protein
MSTRRALAMLVCLALATPAAAQSVLERRYTSDKLDGFWQATLGATPPDPAWFEMLAGGEAEPVADAPPAADLGVPCPGVIIGESVHPAGGGAAKAFPVIPLPAEEAAILNRRLAWAELYLARYRFFERVSTDDAATLAALTERQYAAGLEAWLILARLYYSAPDLQEKCARLTRLEAIAAGPLSGLSEEAGEPDWLVLVPIQAAASAGLDAGPLAALVCSVQPVRGRGEMARIVETRVAERIMQEVRAKVEDTLVLLRAASEEFQALVNDMDVEILSAEIMELERVLGNAQANMLLVKEDQLNAAQTIATLKAVDLSSLNQPGELSELQTATERMAAMTALMDAVLGALAGLDGVQADPESVATLAPCAGLRGAYPAIDLTRDTGVLTAEIMGPYEDCIGRARAVLARFQDPSLQKAQMAELAARVRQLSEAILTSGGP